MKPTLGAIAFRSVAARGSSDQSKLEKLKAHSQMSDNETSLISD